MIIKIFSSLAVTGFAFSFAAFAWVNIQHPLEYTESFIPIWWGYLLFVLGAWLSVMYLIWNQK